MKKYFAVLAGLLLLGITVSFCEMGSNPEKNLRKEGMMGQKPDVSERTDEDEAGGYMLPMKELNLSEEQKKAVENITLEQKRFKVKKEAEIKLARIDLAEILRADKPDFAAAKQKIRDISVMQTDLKLSAIDTREKIFNTLTKEQQDKLPKIKAERREKWMEKKHKDKNVKD